MRSNINLPSPEKSAGRVTRSSPTALQSCPARHPLECDTPLPVEPIVSQRTRSSFRSASPESTKSSVSQGPRPHQLLPQRGGRRRDRHRRAARPRHDRALTARVRHACGGWPPHTRPQHLSTFTLFSSCTPTHQQQVIPLIQLSLTSRSAFYSRTSCGCPTARASRPSSSCATRPRSRRPSSSDAASRLMPRACQRTSSSFTSMAADDAPCPKSTLD